MSEREREGEMDRQTNRQRTRQAGREAVRHVGGGGGARQADRQIDGSWKVRQSERQRDRQTHRDRQRQCKKGRESWLLFERSVLPQIHSAKVLISLAWRWLAFPLGLFCCLHAPIFRYIFSCPIFRDDLPNIILSRGYT